MAGKRKEANLPQPLSDFITLLKQNSPINVSDLDRIRTSLKLYYNHGADLSALELAIQNLSDALSARNRNQQTAYEFGTEFLENLRILQLRKQWALCLNGFIPGGNAKQIQTNATAVIDLSRRLIQEGNYEARQLITDAIKTLSDLLKSNIIASKEIDFSPPVPKETNWWEDIFSSEPPPAPKPMLNSELLEVGYTLLADLNTLKRQRDLEQMLYNFFNLLQNNPLQNTKLLKALQCLQSAQDKNEYASSPDFKSALVEVLQQTEFLRGTNLDKALRCLRDNLNKKEETVDPSFSSNLAEVLNHADMFQNINRDQALRSLLNTLNNSEYSFDLSFKSVLANALEQVESNLNSIVVHSQQTLIDTFIELANGIGHIKRSLDELIADKLSTHDKEIAQDAITTLQELLNAVLPELKTEDFRTTLSNELTDLDKLAQREKLVKEKLKQAKDLFSHGKFNPHLFTNFFSSQASSPLASEFRKVGTLLSDAENAVKDCHCADENIFPLTIGKYQPALIPAQALKDMYHCKVQLFKQYSKEDQNPASLNWKRLFLQVTASTPDIPSSLQKSEQKPRQRKLGGAKQNEEFYFLIGAEACSNETLTLLLDFLASPKLSFLPLYQSLCQQPLKPIACLRYIAGFQNTFYGFIQPGYVIVVKDVKRVRVFQPSSIGEVSGAASPSDLFYFVPLEWAEALKTNLEANVANPLSECADAYKQAQEKSEEKKKPSATKKSPIVISTKNSALAEQILSQPARYMLPLPDLYQPSETTTEQPNILSRFDSPRNAIHFDGIEYLQEKHQPLASAPAIIEQPPSPRPQRSSRMWMLYLGIALSLGVIGLAASLTLHLYGLSPLAFILDQFNLAQAKLFIGMTALPIAANLAFGFGVMAVIGGLIDLVIFTIHSLVTSEDDNLASPTPSDENQLAVLRPAPTLIDASEEAKAEYGFCGWFCCKTSSTSEKNDLRVPVPTPLQ